MKVRVLVRLVKNGSHVVIWYLLQSYFVYASTVIKKIKESIGINGSVSTKLGN